MVQALRTSLRYGGLRQGGLQPGLGNDDIFATASLDLNFAVNKNLGTLVDATTGTNLVNHTRVGGVANAATYVGSDGLIKTATTNYLLQSEDFSATWSADGVCAVSTDQILSPIGTSTADKITVDAGGPNRVSQTPTFQVSAGGTYIISAYVKTLDINIIGIRIFLSGSDAYADYHFANNSFSVTNSTVLTQTGYTPLSDGWTRIFVKYEPTVSGNVNTRIGGGFGGTSESGSFYIWGAQLEQSSTVGEYIPTTSTINSAPRFDHDPTTGESLGLLVEEQRTNLITDSSLTTIGTTFGATISSTTETNPEGIDFCRRLLSDAGTSANGRRVRVAASSGKSITVSAFVKKDTHRYVYIGFGGVANSFTALFDIDPTVTGDRLKGQGGLGTHTSIDAGYQNFPNGWVRIWAVGTTSGIDGTTIGLSPNDFTDTITNWNAVGTEAIFIHGVQYEDDVTFPTSYIPTFDNPLGVTRAADVASISGSAFASFYNQTEGTIYAEATPRGFTNTDGIVSIDDDSAAERLQIRTAANTGGLNFIVVDNNSVQSNTSTANYSVLNQANKYSAAYKLNSFASCLNAGSTTSGTGTVPTPTQLQIGIAEALSESNFNGPIGRVCYWSQRLPDETLQAVTT